MALRLSVIALVALSACATRPSPLPQHGPFKLQPLDVLPAAFDRSLARADLITSAQKRFGTRAVEQAVSADTYLIAKRFAGMAPPPPPGAGPDWLPPPDVALLIRGQAGWLAATGNEWRHVEEARAAELDRTITDGLFWRESEFTPPCPDFGANLLLLKVPGRQETVRNSQCSSRASQLVAAALSA